MNILKKYLNQCKTTRRSMSSSEIAFICQAYCDMGEWFKSFIEKSDVSVKNKKHNSLALKGGGRDV